MIKRLAVTKGQEPTLEQLKEVEEAKKYPIEFDEHRTRSLEILKKIMEGIADEKDV